METKHNGFIRGGCNTVARFHLHIIPPKELTAEEMDAIFSDWDEEFNINGVNWIGRYYSINTRREFAVVPAMIRKAERIGYNIATSMWDIGIKGSVNLSDNPEKFWKCLAMAQAYFRDKE